MFKLMYRTVDYPGNRGKDFVWLPETFSVFKKSSQIGAHYFHCQLMLLLPGFCCILHLCQLADIYCVIGFTTNYGAL